MRVNRLEPQLHLNLLDLERSEDARLGTGPVDQRVEAVDEAEHVTLVANREVQSLAVLQH